jgi:hypothetical protein
LAEGQSIGESSAGAVKKRLDQPLGTRITESLTDLEQMQEELRSMRPVPVENEEEELLLFEDDLPSEVTEPEEESFEPAWEAEEPAWEPEQPLEPAEPRDGENDAMDEINDLQDHEDENSAAEEPPVEEEEIELP